MIPYGRQTVDDDDIAAVVATLRGDWLTQGPEVDRFEAAVAAAVGAQYAVAFANGTAALHGAAVATGIGPEDLVVTSPLSFAASANCALYVGARAGFVDIDPVTLNMDLAKLPGDADAVVAVHFAGLPLDMSTMSHRPRVVIEDAAHALGAIGPDGPVGNCARSDATVFSFHPVKAITTGEGGVVTTNSREVAECAKRFRHHGITRQPEHGEWYYEIQELGFNYRLTDMQAALGSSQLRKLEPFVARRNELARRYRNELADLAIEPAPDVPPFQRHAYHLFPVRVRDRAHLFTSLRAAGIGVQVHYVPIHWHPIYARLGFARGDFPLAEAAYAALISLPLYPGLTDGQQDEVITELRRLVAVEE
jgi:UDP-4-amino-4,6-dideoxy-N-acetyl-beta-L-altrosamine transaminase